MHQHPRRSPVRSTSAKSSNLRSGSSSNARAGDDQHFESDKIIQPVVETRASSKGTKDAVSNSSETSVQSKESIAKLSQVVQVRSSYMPTLQTQVFNTDGRARIISQKLLLSFCMPESLYLRHTRKIPGLGASTNG